MKNGVVIQTVAQGIYDESINRYSLKDNSVVVLDIGHFDNVTGLDDFSINTSKLGVEVFNLAQPQRRKNVKFLFTVLVDDVGLQCSDDAKVCYVGTESQKALSTIPVEIEEIISQTSGYRKDRAKLFSEKNARNRGIQYFRKNLEDLTKAVDSHFIFDESAGKGLYGQLKYKLSDYDEVLMADMKTETMWSGHCPLLMGMHYFDVAKWALSRFSGGETIYILDCSLNDDRGKVNAGAEIAVDMASREDIDLSVINVCFADDDLELYVIDQHGAKL